MLNTRAQHCLPLITRDAAALSWKDFGSASGVLPGNRLVANLILILTGLCRYGCVLLTVHQGIICIISKISLLTLAFVSDPGHQDVLARSGKGRREELVNWLRKEKKFISLPPGLGFRISVKVCSTFEHVSFVYPEVLYDAEGTGCQDETVHFPLQFPWSHWRILSRGGAGRTVLWKD